MKLIFERHLLTTSWLDLYSRSLSIDRWNSWKSWREIAQSWTKMREICGITDEDDRCVTYADKAISMIDRDDIWGVLEASKVLKYLNPSSEGKRYFLTLFKLSWIAWSRIYSETERTMSINNLMDYVICVCKLKYQPNFLLFSIKIFSKSYCIGLSSSFYIVAWGNTVINLLKGITI